MFRPLMIMGLVAALAIAVESFKLKADWTSFKDLHKVSSILTESEQPVLQNSISANRQSAQTSQDWTVIASQNPFSFDRTDTPIVVSPPTPAKPKTPKPFLFGTMMIGDNRTALLGPGNPGSRSYRALQVGEELEGWKVLQIGDKSVLVQWESVRETLLINDPTAQIPRDSAKTLASATSVIAPAASTGLQQTSDTPARAAPAPSSTGTGGKKTRIIHTPFGDKEIEESPQ